jgi:hypothetical protein
MGFVLGELDAQVLIEQDEKNEAVLFPYLVGEDVNSRDDASASRWIINFHDWSEMRAREYSEVFSIVERDVKPERQRRKADGSFALRKPLPQRYWQYADKRPAMLRAISGLDQAIVLAKVSKIVIPARVPTRQVFSHRLAVFASEDSALLAILSSSVHYWWAVTWTSTLETRVHYSPSDAFETFPLPEFSNGLCELGDRLDIYRQRLMSSRNLGLTKAYNMVFDPTCLDKDIEDLRRIHRAIDEVTTRAYGWADRVATVGGLDHGFHQVGRETRYTIGPAAQREVLDSLLELNHERYGGEVARGLYDKKRGSWATAAVKGNGALFDVE